MNQKGVNHGEHGEHGERPIEVEASSVLSVFSVVNRCLGGLLCLWVGAAGPAFGSEVLMRALGDEMQRSIQRLRMGDLEKPYFISYTARDLRRSTLRCDFGGLVTSSSNDDRSLKAEVRVGDAAFDDRHYASGDIWRYRAFVGDLPLEDDYDAIRFSVWKLTDQAYKTALERLSQKKAYKASKNIVEVLPDLTLETPAKTLLAPAAAAFDRAAWEPLVCEAAAVFREFPAMQQSWVYMDVGIETRYFLNSEGAQAIRPNIDVEFQFGGEVQAPDGMKASQYRRLLFRSVDGLPTRETLLREVRAFGKELTEWTQAPAQSEYVGPVLFEGAGAAEFINQMLGHNLGNPRAMWLENEDDKKRFPTGALTSRGGLRVTAPFLHVVDDPTLASVEGVTLAGTYPVDEEGIPAQRVVLVEKGRLKDVLMSRSPAKGHARSNGHARGGFWDLPTARPANLIVSADGAVPGAELRRRFLDLVREAGLEYGLVVKRLNFEDEKEDEDLLSDPAALYRVYAKDGREERVRDAEFDGVSLRALRDIVAVSQERSVYNFYERGYINGSRGEIPASVVAPAILVEEMEFKKTEKKPEKLPYLKHPFFN